MTQPNFRHRITRAVQAFRGKEFIPALPSEGGGSSARVKTYASKHEQLSANVGWCFTANNAITEPLSAIPLKLYSKTKSGKKEDVGEHELLDLIDNPRHGLTGEQLRQLDGSYLNFTGESYILMLDNAGAFEPRKGKLPGALDIFPSHKVGFRLGDVYTASTVSYAGNTYPIHSFIRNINPSLDNPYRGRSVIEASALTLDLEEQMKRWSQSTFANGAQPSLVFTADEPMEDKIYERWKEQFADEHTGTDNAGRPLLIEGGDVKPFMMSARDLDFLKSRQFSKDEILAMWRVSPEIIGYTVNSNRSTMDAAFTLHAIINLVPRIRQWVKLLNATLVKPYDPSLELGFESPVPEDVEAKIRLAEKASGRFLTIDEVREMYGHAKLPNGLGKQIYMSGSNRSLESIANPPQPAPAPPSAVKPLTDEEDEEGGDTQAGGKKAA